MSAQKELRQSRGGEECFRVVFGTVRTIAPAVVRERGSYRARCGGGGVRRAYRCIFRPGPGNVMEKGDARECTKVVESHVASPRASAARLSARAWGAGRAPACSRRQEPRCGLECVRSVRRTHSAQNKAKQSQRKTWRACGKRGNGPSARAHRRRNKANGTSGKTPVTEATRRKQRAWARGRGICRSGSLRWRAARALGRRRGCAPS